MLILTLKCLLFTDTMDPNQVKLNKLFILFSLYFLGQFLNFFRIRIQNKICTPIMAQTIQTFYYMFCRIDVFRSILLHTINPQTFRKQAFFVEQTINRLSHHTNQPQTIDCRCFEEQTFLQIIPLHTTNPQSYVKRFFAEQTFYKTKQSKRPPFSSLHQLAFYIHPSTNPPNLTHTQPITPIIYSHPTQPIPTHITS